MFLDRPLSLVSLAGVGLLGLATLLSDKPAPAADPAAAPADEHVQFFEQQIEPILKARCYKCHGEGEKLRGNFRVTSRGGLLRGGELGPAIDLESPEKSMLLEAINYSSLEMPPSGKLPKEEIALLTRWVKLGAPWTPGVEDDHPAEEDKPLVTEADRNYWAYRPVQRPDLPAVEQADWVANPIDRFILARLEAAGLRPSEPADRLTLVRRLYYDLTGLPPSPAEIDAFLNDRSPQAYSQLVDRLLDSPHYGEKWGRHWLDLVRYAETNGYERDGDKPEVWRYRDYVIRAFNQDKRYDDFIREQLAGDESVNPSPDALIATGYYRLGLWDDEPVDRQQAFFDSLDDVVSTTSQVFLGMTVGCARCHDHKIDPIPQRDYYRLLAFFRNTYQGGGRAFTYLTLRPIADRQVIAENERRKRQLDTELKATDQAIKQLEAKVFATLSNPEKEDARDAKTRRVLLQEKRAAALSPEELSRLEKLLAQRKKIKETRLRPLPKALVMQENGREAPDTFVLIRGNAHAHGPQVHPGFPEVLGGEEAEPLELLPPVKSTGRRSALAEWIASETNPLTARVMVNRIWQHHFGRGLVESTSDFGNAGASPTHPALLDWLAAEFMAQEWSIKQMHRLILSSAAYRMASAPREAALAKDPQNRLLWRYNMRRLTAEEVRDSILAVTGELNLQMFGPSVYPPLPSEVLATASRPGAAWGKSPPEQAARRSIYVKIKRSLRHPMLTAFDAADTDSSCAVRFVTTVPTQALSMLNSQFMNERAAQFAARLQREAPDNVAAQVRRAIRLTTGRQASDEEIAADVAFIEKLQAEDGRTAQQALRDYCLMTLNLNEFVYLD